MTDLSEEEKSKIAKGLVNTVVKECELHGMEFVKLPYKMQKLLEDVAYAGMKYGAKVMMEVVKDETPY